MAPAATPAQAPRSATAAAKNLAATPASDDVATAAASALMRAAVAGSASPRVVAALGAALLRTLAARGGSILVDGRDWYDVAERAGAGRVAAAQSGGAQSDGHWHQEACRGLAHGEAEVVHAAPAARRGTRGQRPRRRCSPRVAEAALGYMVVQGGVAGGKAEPHGHNTVTADDSTEECSSSSEGSQARTQATQREARSGVKVENVKEALNDAKVSVEPKAAQEAGDELGAISCVKAAPDATASASEKELEAARHSVSRDPANAVLVKRLVNLAATSNLSRLEGLELDELSEGFSSAVSDEVGAARRRVACRDLGQFSQRKTEFRPSEHGKAEAAREHSALRPGEDFERSVAAGYEEAAAATAAAGGTVASASASGSAMLVEAEAASEQQCIADTGQAKSQAEAKGKRAAKLAAKHDEAAARAAREAEADRELVRRAAAERKAIANAKGEAAAAAAAMASAMKGDDTQAELERLAARAASGDAAVALASAEDHEAAARAARDIEAELVHVRQAADAREAIVRAKSQVAGAAAAMASADRGFGMQIERGQRAAVRAAKRDEDAAKDAAKRGRLEDAAREASAKYEVVRLAASAACNSEAVAQARAGAEAACFDLVRFRAALTAEAKRRAAAAAAAL